LIAHEWSAGPPAVSMDSAGDEFFTGSAFSLNQNRRVRGRRLGNEFGQFAHDGAVTDEIVSYSQVLLQPEILGFKPLDIRGLLEGDRRYCRDARQEVELGAVKLFMGIGTIGINDANASCECVHGDAQDRLHLGILQTLDAIDDGRFEIV